MLLERPWIHTVGAIASSLHQKVKFIINVSLITIKAEEVLPMIKNMVIPYIETEYNTGDNLHDFEVVNGYLKIQC
jgi:hypothetical protein